MSIASRSAAGSAPPRNPIAEVAQSRSFVFTPDTQNAPNQKAESNRSICRRWGFSLGAVRAGFDLVAAVDLDPHAAESHHQNFPTTAHGRRNILNLQGDDLRDLAGMNSERLTGLIGGPPCQGFSTMGKMRKNDARNKLFYHFFRLVSESNPLFFVCENVPGILDEKYDVLRSESLSLIKKKYHVLNPFELSASDFGAPTERSRVLFVGWAKDSGLDFSSDDFSVRGRAKITVRMAFEGLPRSIRKTWQTEKSSWREVQISDSTFLKRINRLNNFTGDKIARERFTDRNEVSGFFGTDHTPEVVERFSKVKPGKMDSISKFPRLKWDALCPTLRAGTAADRGSYQAARPIHPSQDRVITPREAARLQGFPDWFQFHPTKWHSFRQIGNSVSPILGEAVLKNIEHKLL
jgi:DNA (cytosine-5)-methyltransferase 1